MIEITVTDKEGIIHSLHISGHANSNERGKDLVCAGVSAVGVGMLNALDQLAHDTCQLAMRDGDIRVNVNDVTEQNQMILKTSIVQLATIERTNKKFIRIKKQEV